VLNSILIGKAWGSKKPGGIAWKKQKMLGKKPQTNKHQNIMDTVSSFLMEGSFSLLED